MQKASRHIPNMRREENKVGDSESIEMTPLPATNDSRGRVQLLALSCSLMVIDMCNYINQFRYFKKLMYICICITPKNVLCA